MPTRYAYYNQIIIKLMVLIKLIINQALTTTPFSDKSAMWHCGRHTLIKKT